MTVTKALSRLLKNPELFVDLALLPEATAARIGKRFSVFNPSTGELLAELPHMETADIAAAIDRADAAREHWAGLSARERSDTLWRWHQLILEHNDDLAAILTAEMGKPLAEAKIRNRPFCGVSPMVCRGGQSHLWRNDLGAIQ